MFKTNTNGFTSVNASIMVKISARKVPKKTNKQTKTCVEKGIAWCQILCVSIKKNFFFKSDSQSIHMHPVVDY